MNNSVLAQKLEGCIITFVDDFDLRIQVISDSNGNQNFGRAMVHGMHQLIDVAEGKPLHVMNIITIIEVIITKMLENHYPKPEVLSALNIVPSYLTIIISDNSVRQEAITVFNDDMASLRKWLALK